MAKSLVPRAFLAFLLIGLSLAACEGPLPPPPAASATPAPSASPTGAVSPSAEPTLAATHSPSPSPSPSATEAASPYPLKLGPGGRYLVDQNDRPFLLAGDAAWSLIAQLSPGDAGYYLDQRQEQGFNTVLVSLIEHKFALNAPANLANEPPFNGRPFATPNEAYFAHADAVIQAAAQREMLVLLAPLYLGYQCGDEGWCAEIQAADEAELRAWGSYVGQRYARFDNILWVIGGDADPRAGGVEDKVRLFTEALLQADPRHLVTAHNAPEQMAVTPWPNSQWLNVNTLYTALNTYDQGRGAYFFGLPFFQIEGSYENTDQVSRQKLREQTYWTFLSGGFGFVFGNGPIWCFSAPECLWYSGDWKAELNSPGSLDAARAQAFFNSLPWATLIPDWEHHVVFGEGMNQPGKIEAAVSADATLLVVYFTLPETVTVDLSHLSKEVGGSWYDPTSGESRAVEGSPFANSGTVELTPPGNNAAGAADWVLLLR